ncbi:MAG: prolipoprotein diacylglyceryl transferase family protein [Clostridiaceae bacterium]
MIDKHLKLTADGYMPYIFGFPSYTLFVTIGIIAGIIYYLADAGKRNAKGEGVIEIVSAALIFGVIGSKIPLILEGDDIRTVLFSKSIIGGLIGGMLGVMFIKRLLNIKLKMGNIIAPAAALGIAIGRIGCFFNGCCYGKPTAWGVDFGDGILRCPVQLFEVAFHFTAFIILHNLKSRVRIPGILFNYYVLAYFVFRFFIEYIRENPVVYAGMTVYQIICLSGGIFVLINLEIKYKKRGAFNGK